MGMNIYMSVLCDVTLFVHLVKETMFVARATKSRLESCILKLIQVIGIVLMNSSEGIVE